MSKFVSSNLGQNYIQQFEARPNDPRVITKIVLEKFSKSIDEKILLSFQGTILFRRISTVSIVVYKEGNEM